jgi:hypothetical protein
VDVGLRSFWSAAQQHRLSAYIGPCIPNGLISHKHAVGVSVRKKLQCRDSGFVQSSKLICKEIALQWSKTGKFDY